MTTHKHVLITGATGFVGMNLVKKMIEQEGVHLHLLVRNSETEPAKKRVFNWIKNCYSAEEYPEIVKRIDVIEGDITEENLGLTDRLWNELSCKIDEIFHSAAAIHFHLPYELAYEINTKGTQRVLDFAMACHENNQVLLNYISTAYVAGVTSDIFLETDLAQGQEFGNTYEQTKYEAELLVHSYVEKGLPTIIYRPSIISGDFSTGEITKSNLIFDFIVNLNKGIFKDFICDEDSSINIIPVDYFVDALMHISKSEENIGKTFNIVSRKNVKIRDLLKACCHELGVDTPEFVPLEEKKNASKLTRLALLKFIHYLELSHMFDDALAAEALSGTGITCPELDYSFTCRILSYCKENGLIE